MIKIYKGHLELLLTMTNMPLKNITANNFFDLRKLDFEGPHLSTIDLPIRYNIEQALVKWIETNLKKRYYLGKCTGLTSKNKLEDVVRVGFEDPKELSYFALACPHLKYK